MIISYAEIHELQFKKLHSIITYCDLMLINLADDFMTDVQVDGFGLKPS